MKRGPFIGTAAALIVSGCGGRTVSGVLPRGASSAPSFADAADVIPASVLRSPIVGETYRFDGAVAPAGWLLMQGQTLAVADYPALFRILRTSAGGDGKTTFKLPSTKAATIIAVAGTFPSSPQVFAQLGRHTSALTDQLGAGARLTMRVPSARAQARQTQVDAALRDARELSVNAPRIGPALPDSPERVARAAQAAVDARTTALAALSATNRAGVLGLVEGILAGGITVYAATQRIAASLGDDEARAVLDVYDATQRALGGTAAPHANPRLEAGRYLLGIAFTPDQLRRLRTMQVDG